jgi:HEAT repeat protein
LSRECQPFFERALREFRLDEEDRRAAVRGLAFARNYRPELAGVPVRHELQLQVDAVLIGSILKSGERFRVTAQLIDAKNGEILWSEKIDTDTKEILAVQDHISEKVIDGLSGGSPLVNPLDLLHNGDETQRLDAIKMLEVSYDPHAVPALVESLRDRSLKVKAAAVQALIKKGRDASGPVIEQLNDALDEGDCVTARFAARALGLIGDASISPVLLA